MTYIFQKQPSVGYDEPSELFQFILEDFNYRKHNILTPPAYDRHMST